MCAAFSGEADETVDSTRLRHLAARLRLRSDEATLSKVLLGAGLSRESYAERGSRLDPHAEAEFVRRACDALDDSAFAVEAGLSYRQFASIPSYVARFSMTLGKAMERATKLAVLAGASTTFSLRISGDRAGFEMECADGVLLRHHRHQEFLLFATFSQMREIVGVDLFPIEIGFRHVRHADADRVSKLAGCPVNYGARNTGILLNLSALDLPVPTYDPTLRDYLEAHGGALLRARGGLAASLRNRVEKAIVDHLPDRMLTAGEAAALLGMSLRTFSRRLAAADLSYRALAEDIRRDLGRTYLKDDRLQVTEIAHLLGYGGSAAFSGAFRRWEGSSPSAFRRRRRAAEERGADE